VLSFNLHQGSLELKESANHLPPSTLARPPAIQGTYAVHENLDSTTERVAICLVLLASSPYNSIPDLL
jgi:hypothetical protein